MARMSGTAPEPSGTPSELLVTATDERFAPAARRWAARLGASWRVGDDRPGAEGLELIVGADGLVLVGSSGTPVRAEAGALAATRPGRDLLGKAVGKGDGEVVDATAGLGRDAFQLAAAGFEVTMVERVAVVAALLEDALERAAAGLAGPAAAEAAARVTLVVADSRAWLEERRRSGDLPAVVLLDPMYPKRGKAALPGKGMALFRRLVGADADAQELLEAALTAATRRVVVKRPLKAPPLAGVAPSGSLRGSTTRYDLYAPRPRERKL